MPTEYRNPKPTVDLIIQMPDASVVLIKRRNPPYGWALPGGFVDEGESLEHAAVREALEETSLQVELLLQMHTYSDPSRDPRQHTISTVFIAKPVSGTLLGADDAAEAACFRADALPSPMAFDHAAILQDFFERRWCKQCIAWLEK